NYINIQQTGGSGVQYWDPLVAEFYNAGAVDGSSCSAATSATISAGSITPTQVGDLFFQAKITTNTLSTSPPFNLPIQTASFTAGAPANIGVNLTAAEAKGGGGG